VNLELLIVEDSLSYAIELEQLAIELGFNVLATVDNSADALDVIFSDPPDLILMDINIKGRMSGIDIGKSIVHLEIPILYITSFNDNATYEEAMESNQVGYIVKPVDKLTLATSLKLLIKNSFKDISLSKNTGIIEKDDLEYIFFMRNNTFNKVMIDEILFVKSSDNYSSFNLLDGSSFLIRIKLSEVEELLSRQAFIRCHRQYIVNQNKIEVISSTKNTLNVSGHEIPFSKTKKAEIMSIGLFLR